MQRSRYHVYYILGLNALNKNIETEFIDLSDFEMALQKVKSSVTHEDRMHFL